MGVSVAGQKHIENGGEILEIICSTYIVRPQNKSRNKRRIN